MKNNMGNAMINEKQSDHNLLIRLDQKVTDLQAAVKELGSGTVSKIASLERDKADRKEVEELQKKVNHDIEVRVEGLEKWRASTLVYLAIYGVVGGFLATTLIYHLMDK